MDGTVLSERNVMRTNILRNPERITDIKSTKINTLPLVSKF